MEMKMLQCTYLIMGLLLLVKNQFQVSANRMFYGIPLKIAGLTFIIAAALVSEIDLYQYSFLPLYSLIVIPFVVLITSIMCCPSHHPKLVKIGNTQSKKVTKDAWLSYKQNLETGQIG